MKYLRKSKERGYADHGWLKSYHTFSFADYYDSNFMGFGPLRVINEDDLEPGTGFPLHGHKNMEIITLVLEGAIEHKDILGNKEIVPYGHIQRMSAGSGIRHSEFNPSNTENLKLLQVWIEPNQIDVPPRYDRKDFTLAHQQTGLKTLVTSNNSSNQLSIYQKATISHGLYLPKEKVNLALNTESKYWIQLFKGQLKDTQSDLILVPGDGLAITQETKIEFETDQKTEFYLFEFYS